ncbi:MAG: DMT family transporter [Dehalococcoidia bacterium]
MLLGDLAGMGSAALWAVSSLIMAGCSRRMPALALSAIRLLFGVLFYVTLLFATGNVAVLFRLGGGTALALAGTAIMSMGLGDTMYIAGMHRIGVSRASPISVTVYPLLTVLLAWALLGELISLKTALGGALVLGGIVLVVLRPGGETASPVSKAPAPPIEREAVERSKAAAAGSAVAVAAAVPVASASPVYAQPALSLAGLLLVLGATVTWACSTVWLRTLTSDVSVVVVNSVRVPVTAAVLAGAATSRGLLRFGSCSRNDLALVGVAGLVGSGIGSLLYVFSLEKVGAGQSSLLNSLSPVFALPLAAYFLKERITRPMVLGTSLALGGAWLFVV